MSEKDLAKRRERYKRKGEVIRAQNTTWRKKNKEKVRDAQMRRNFGVSLKEYEEMFFEQGGLCAICGKPETTTMRNAVKFLAIDHDHVTGKVRKLLCHRCNTALGLVGDSIEVLKKMIEYLEVYKMEVQ